MRLVTTQKFLLASPRKLRDVAALVKKLAPLSALEVLPFLGKRPAISLAKVIKTGLANAKAAGLAEANLIFKEIQIGEGPRLKRGRPVSRGRWHPYKRRMSHIRIVLESKEPDEKGAESGTKN